MGIKIVKIRSKENILKNIEIKRIKHINYAEGIFKILNERLLTYEEYRKLNDKEKEKLTNEGFVIGQHSLQTLQEWIENDKNYIITAELRSGEDKEIIGFTLILGTEDIQDLVRTYAKQIIFEKETYKNIISKKDFLYLIQICVAKNFSNLKIGTKILDESFKLTNKAIVSFVIKSPIQNKASLYFHLKNGFRYLGDYLGDYGDFKNYNSTGLIYMQKYPPIMNSNILNLIEYINKEKRENE